MELNPFATSGAGHQFSADMGSLTAATPFELRLVPGPTPPDVLHQHGCPPGWAKVIRDSSDTWWRQAGGGGNGAAEIGAMTPDEVVRACLEDPTVLDRWEVCSSLSMVVTFTVVVSLKYIVCDPSPPPSPTPPTGRLAGPAPERNNDGQG